jgi:hypothetical protein
VIFSLAALYPFTFGDLRSIPDFLVIEWLTLVVFVSMMNKLIIVNSLNNNFKKLKLKGIEIFNFALLILIMWAIVSIINNEIIKQKIVIGGETGTKRAYFDIFNNVLIFFTTIIYFVINYRDIDIQRFLKTILYISLAVGVVRGMTFYLRITTPLIGGIFTYDPISSVSEGLKAQRLLGLDYVADIGIPALFSLYVFKNRINLIALFILLIFLFLSGGRTTMIGVTLSIVIFSILFLPKNFIYFIIVGCVLLLVAVVFLPQGFLQSKATRLSTMEQTGFMGQDMWRGTAWYFYFKNFIIHPIFGKGIGNYTGFIYSTFPGTEDFVREQMVSGGHGSYFSALGIFGLGGIVYLIILIFGGIILSFRKIKQNINLDHNKTAISVFCFMVLINFSILLITGFNGLTDIPFIFYCVGLICSIKVLENNPFLNQDINEDYQ